MKYITEQDAIEAAQKSTEAATQCSIKHWKQLLNAPEKDFDEDRDTGGTTCYPGASFCSLCKRFWTTSRDLCEDECPLSLIGQNCFEEDSVYQKALNNCNLWSEGGERELFTESCKEMIKTLESCLTQENPVKTINISGL